MTTKLLLINLSSTDKFIYLHKTPKEISEFFFQQYINHKKKKK